MAYKPDGNSYRTAQAGYSAATGTAVLDAGLRAYMLPRLQLDGFRPVADRHHRLRHLA